MSRPRRDLTSEDLKIWRHVTRSVLPLQGMTSRHPSDSQDDDPEEPPRPKVSPASVADTSSTTSRSEYRAALPSPLALGAVADIDRRTAQRFTRGEMPVDGRIDLHGLTLDQAHSALTSFMLGASSRGARCVVVVTGKGKGGEIGKIRNETPHWLNRTPLRPLILAVSEARARDGGAGALYVLLKRKR